MLSNVQNPGLINSELRQELADGTYPVENDPSTASVETPSGTLPSTGSQIIFQNKTTKYFHIIAALVVIGGAGSGLYLATKHSSSSKPPTPPSPPESNVNINIWGITPTNFSNPAQCSSLLSATHYHITGTSEIIVNADPLPVGYRYCDLKHVSSFREAIDGSASWTIKKNSSVFPSIQPTEPNRELASLYLTFRATELLTAANITFFQDILPGRRADNATVMVNASENDIDVVNLDNWYDNAAFNTNNGWDLRASITCSTDGFMLLKTTAWCTQTGTSRFTVACTDLDSTSRVDAAFPLSVAVAIKIPHKIYHAISISCGQTTQLIALTRLTQA